MTQPRTKKVKHKARLPQIATERGQLVGEAFDEFGAIERQFHALIGRCTAGISPNAYSLAFRDWFEHLALSPGKQMELLSLALNHLMLFQHQFASAMLNQPLKAGMEPDPTDRRFKSELWQGYPFNVYKQGFLLYRDWWKQATSAVRGVNPHSMDLVSFAALQMIDAFAPSNFVPTNPVLVKATCEQAGMNLLTGSLNLCEDSWRRFFGKKPLGLAPYEVGKNLACTKGQVVYRNELLELIQYVPKTKKVYAEPIFIVPAWIMKYYILDLSAHNSLVNYLVQQGHTVFIISWKNPTKAYRNVGMDDYLHNGLFAALNVVQELLPNKNIHCAGYCLGGTLLAIAASWLGKRHKHAFQTITLFAAQVDFEEAGELHMFIDESQLCFLEDIMQQQGFLDKHQMKGIFHWLRSNELIWSNMISNYLMGERALFNDLMAWNEDATRMPYKMHSEYLRQLYLNNELADGKYKVNNSNIALSDIDIPIFAVGTQWDHIAPWKSVYKTHLLTETDMTFVLTTGGHNAGIISEPGHRERSFQIKTTHKNEAYRSPEKWRQETPITQGSWWPAWQNWLVDHSSKPKIVPPPMGLKNCPSVSDAPGIYVLEP